MKFKHGKINEGPTAVNPGDIIRLSYEDFSSRRCIHEETIMSPRTYTHWVFLSMDGIGDGVFMGTDALLSWVKDTFPAATEVFDDTPVLV